MTNIALGVTNGIRIENDRPLIERLIEAFLRANESACYSDDSQWATIRRMQKSVSEAIRARDTQAVSNILRRPHESYLLYGFEDLGVWSVEAYKNPDRRTGYAAHCYELLQRLARATGVLALPNPEAPDREISVPELPVLLDRLEAVLGFYPTARAVSVLLRARDESRCPRRARAECCVLRVAHPSTYCGPCLASHPRGRRRSRPPG